MKEPVSVAGETPESRLKRLRLRSWRRGTREMDLILGPFADEMLPTLDPETLNAYEALLSENDQDLYSWVSGRAEPAPEHGNLIVKLREFKGIR